MARLLNGQEGCVFRVSLAGGAQSNKIWVPFTELPYEFERDVQEGVLGFLIAF
jgi:hypothetical protein